MTVYTPVKVNSEGSQAYDRDVSGETGDSDNSNAIFPTLSWHYK